MPHPVVSPSTFAPSRRFPADHLGPLLPPPTLVSTLEGVGAAERPCAIDDAVAALLVQQRDAWISLATDGELRRRYAGVTDPVAEARLAVGRSALPVKQRLPRGDGGALVDAVTLQAVADLGVRCVQLDGRDYTPLLKRRSRDTMRSTGRDPDREIARRLDHDRTALHRVSRERVKLAVCFHDVNDPTAAPWADDLDLDAAERVFRQLPVDRFVFDVGDGVAFDFLRRLPHGTEAVLGLVDVRADTLPDPAALVRRIDAAARFIDTDRLALSPRHALSCLACADPAAAWGRQQQVLDLLFETASQAWGLDF